MEASIDALLASIVVDVAGRPWSSCGRRPPWEHLSTINANSAPIVRTKTCHPQSEFRDRNLTHTKTLPLIFSAF